MARRRVRPFQLSLESEWEGEDPVVEEVPVRHRDDAVVACFTDGGLASNNPSKVGGSWAYVLANAAGEVVREASGFIEVGVYGLDEITNNIAELWAVIEAFEALPNGWCGSVFTDSKVTLRRFTTRCKWDGTPEELRQKAHCTRNRLGRLSWVLLGGHPNPEELKAGVRKDGAPVHSLNVRCDSLCKQRVKEYFSKSSQRAGSLQQ